MAVTHVFTPALSQYANNDIVSRAYPSAVLAGDLLWAFVFQLSATGTVDGVSDSVNGAWTPAGSLVRGDANNGNTFVQGFYLPNSAAGTPTVIADMSTAIHTVIVIGAIRGLAGGGALDQIVAEKVNGPNGTGWQIGTSAALAQAEEGAVALLSMSSAPGTPNWTADATLDNFYFERVQRLITSSTSPVNVGTAGSVGSATTAVGYAMFFKDAGGGGGGGSKLPLKLQLLMGA